MPAAPLQEAEGLERHKRVVSPPEEWYETVRPHLSPKLRALVTLLNTHGLRASEALQRTPDDLDTKSQSWVLRLGECDKAGDRVQIPSPSTSLRACRTPIAGKNRECRCSTTATKSRPRFSSASTRSVGHSGPTSGHLAGKQPTSGWCGKSGANPVEL